MTKITDIVKKYFNDHPRDYETTEEELIRLQANVLWRTGELIDFKDLEILLRYFKHEDVIKDELKHTTPAERKKIEEIVNQYHESWARTLVEG